MGMNVGYLRAGRTSASDECITPRWVVEPVVKYLKAKGFKKIWCPFDAWHSQYVRVLKREGFEVVHSFDFFNTPTPEGVDCIVSNPPFSIKDKIIADVYDRGLPFVLLLPVPTLQGKKRVKLFKEKGLELLVFDARACFYTNGNMKEIEMGNHFGSMYFCHNVLPEPLVFECLEPVQEPYFLPSESEDELRYEQEKADARSS